MLTYRKKVLNKSTIRKFIDRSFFLLAFSIILYISFNYYEKLDKPSKTNNRYVGNVKNIEGDKTPLVNGAIHGWLERVAVQDNDHVEFQGWVFDARNSRVPDDILISHNKKEIFWGRTNGKRPDLVKAFGEDALESGFKFVLPIKLFKDKKIEVSELRFFTFSKGMASELNYFKGFKKSDPVISSTANQTRDEVHIINKDGGKIPLRPGVVIGWLDFMKIKNDGQIVLIGWAFDNKNSRIPDAVLVSYQEENIYWGDIAIKRPDLVEAFGQASSEAGFNFKVPLRLFKDKNINRDELHLYAISNGVASELNYYKGFR